jgi:hypothetical protein
MNLEFLYIANLVLLLRLRWLLVDRPPEPYAWWEKATIESIAVLALLRFGAASVGAIATNFVFAAAAIGCDRRARERNGPHLLLGLFQLAALSIWLGPMLSVEMRPWFGYALRGITGGSSLGPMLVRLLESRAQIFLLGLLVAANEANLLIRWLLSRLQFRSEAKAGVEGNADIDAHELARGRVIGLLERTLIYFFVLNGQFGAVGFTLAAKAFTRFKELEKRSFAEYVLIGTLLSSGLAMLIAAFVRKIMLNPS